MFILSCLLNWTQFVRADEPPIQNLTEQGDHTVALKCEAFKKLHFSKSEIETILTNLDLKTLLERGIIHEEEGVLDSFTFVNCDLLDSENFNGKVDPFNF